MELAESIEYINKQLQDKYGIDTITGRPIWRVAWSEDQFEKRLDTYRDFTPEGLFIREVTEVREVRKYNYIKDRYVLEQLVVIPEVNQSELPVSKLSYEPLWPFEDRNLNYLPPRLDAAIFVIDLVYAVKGKGDLARYKDPEATIEGSLKAKKERIDKIVEHLYGDESTVSDALARHDGVTVPSNYEGKH